MPLSIIDDICKNVEDNEDEYRKEYKELFEYVDIINGTVVSIGTHPCGTIISPIPLNENVGLMSLATCDYPVTMLNMKEMDSQNYVKLDVLGLDNVELINETCKLAGIERLTPDNIDDEDEEVWMSIRDNTLGVFQWEGTGSNYIKDLFSDETIRKIKKVNPNFKYMDLLSVGNSAIRPAGSSYRQDLAMGNFYDNGCEAINNLLSPTLGRVVYQEQIIAFLNQFCGFTMGEADVVRRGFAKKTGTEQFIPRIESGFIKTMKEQYNMSIEESKKAIKSFVDVVISASDYAFSENHSHPYSYIGYICGYLRYYYPLEFFTIFLNINKGNMEKTSNALEYIDSINIQLKNPQFRYSKSEYFMNKETNTIFKGLSSIKFLNEKVSDELYKLKDNQYETFIDLLIDINDNTSCNTRQLDILIKLDYFKEFGGRKKLLKTVELFNKWHGKKTFKLNDLPLKFNLLEQFIDDEELKKLKTKKEFKQFKNIDTYKLCKFLVEQLDNEDLSVGEIIKAEMEFTGSPTYINKDLDDNTLVIISVDTKYTPKMSMYSPISGNTETVKISKKLFKKQLLEVGDVILVNNIFKKNKKAKNENDEWIELDATEFWCDDYDVINEEDLN